MRFAPIFLLVPVALIHCAALTPYAENACGNRVVDVGEDCDDAADPQCKACRLRCDVIGDGGAPLACPPNAGWGCGTDGICRQKSGNLALATPPVSANVYTLKAGDFDADGRVDIIGSPPFTSAGASRVHYFDGKAGLSTVTPLDLSIALPIVADLDHQGGQDIGFSVRNLPVGAFGALAGQADRTFSTIVFPSATYPLTDARFAVVNASPGAGLRLPAGLPGCAVGLRSGLELSSKAITNTFFNVCPAAPAEGEEPGELGGKAPDGLTTADVVGLPKTGRIFDPSDANGSACGQVVFTTATSLWILSPCTSGLSANQKVTWQPAAPVVKVDLPGTLLEEIYVGPVETLARDEILVHVAPQAGSGLGQNRFYVFNRITRDFVPSDKFTPQTGLPLAGGDLDGDDKPDFVLSTAIKLSTPDPLLVSDAAAYQVPVQVSDWKHEIAARDQLRWTSARIGRFNNDALPDVLVSFSNSLDVDVMSNGGGTFTPFTVRSEQIVRAIASGDFDGDRIEDVAFLQSASTLESGDEATLTLAFGSAVGGPEAPRTAGKFRYPRGFGALHGRDGTDNLAVVQITPVTGQPPNTSISVLFGNGGRQQVAPLIMSDPAEPKRRWEPVSFNIGLFPAPNEPAGDTQSIIAISTGFLFRDDPKGGAGQVPYDFRTLPWVARPDPSAVGGLDPFVPVGRDITQLTGLDQSAFEQGRRQLRLITAKGDLDVPKDGYDELVNIAPSPGENAVNVVSVHTQLPNEGVVVTQLQDARVDEGDPIELFDLDGDGFLDLVYIITLSGKRTLSILRGDGKGSFVPAPITTAGTDLKDDAVGFAPLDVGRGTRLAVVTEKQLWLVELGKEQRLRVTNTSSVLGTTTAGITAITGGDINGDGVPDLAIAQAGGIRVILQRPTNEAP